MLSGKIVGGAVHEARQTETQQHTELLFSDPTHCMTKQPPLVTTSGTHKGSSRAYTPSRLRVQTASVESKSFVACYIHITRTHIYHVGTFRGLKRLYTEKLHQLKFKILVEHVA